MEYGNVNVLQDGAVHHARQDSHDAGELVLVRVVDPQSESRVIYVKRFGVDGECPAESLGGEFSIKAVWQPA
jgi:hypothetical protein